MIFKFHLLAFTSFHLLWLGFILPDLVREKIFTNLLEKQDDIILLCIGTIQNIFFYFYNCNLVKWFIFLWTVQKAINGIFVL